MHTPPVSRFANSLRGLSLRAQTLLVVGGALLAGILLYYFAISDATNRSFGRLQREVSEQRTERGIRRLAQFAGDQSRHVSRAARSDVTYDLLQGDKSAYSRLKEEHESATTQSDLILFFDKYKNLSSVRSGGYDGTEIGLPPPINAEIFRNSPLLGSRDSMSVLLTVPDGIWIFSSSPVVHSDGSGPSPGWLVYGTLVGRHRLEEIRSTAAVTIVPATNNEDVAAAGAAKKRRVVETEELGACEVLQPDHSRMQPGDHPITVKIPNALGDGPVTLRVEIEPVIYETALKFRDDLIVVTFLGGLFMIAACLAAVEFLFVRRISRMDRSFLNLAESGDAALRLDVSGGDEFATLAQSANRLLDALRRRRGEIEMQQHLLSSVLDSASEGIMAFRSVRTPENEIEDFTMVMANRAAERIVGRSASEMLGQRLLQLFPGNRESGLFDEYVRVVETGIPADREFFYEADGLSAWFHSSTSPWRDGFVVTFEEISNRKNTEQELQRNLDEIERFNRAMIGREERVLEMKSEVNSLRQKMGLPPAYSVDAHTDEP
jgi:PAS domain S-box-containing protein